MAVTNGGKIVVIKANAGFNGIAIGSQFATDLTKSSGKILVDGNNSIIDASALLTVGEFFAFDNNSKQYVDSGAGGLSELVVRNGGLVKADTILIGLSGTLKGNGGTLQGAVENRGTIAPGESPGTLNVIGDLTQTATGKLVIESGGNTPGLCDVVNVSGKFTMGGTIRNRCAQRLHARTERYVQLLERRFV